MSHQATRLKTLKPALALAEKVLFDEAIEVLKTIVDVDKEHAEAFYLLSHIQSQNKDIDESVESYNTAITLCPAYADNRSSEHMRMTKLIHALDKKISRYVEAMMQAQNIQVSLRENARIYEEALAEGSRSASTYGGLGNLYIALAEYPAAEHVLRQAMDLGTLDEYGVRQTLANALEFQGKLTEALPLYLAVMDAASDDKKVWCFPDLGRLYEKLGQLEQAIQCYQQAKPGSAHRILLAYYFLSHQYERMIDHYAYWIRSIHEEDRLKWNIFDEFSGPFYKTNPAAISPLVKEFLDRANHPDPHLNPFDLACLQLFTGNVEEAIAKLEAQLVKEPQHYLALKLLGIIFYERGKRFDKKSTALLQQCKRINPHDETVNRILESLNR